MFNVKTKKKIWKFKNIKREEILQDWEAVN